MLSQQTIVKALTVPETDGENYMKYYLSVGVPGTGFVPATMDLTKKLSDLYGSEKVFFRRFGKIETWSPGNAYPCNLFLRNMEILLNQQSGVEHVIYTGPGVLRNLAVLTEYLDGDVTTILFKGNDLAEQKERLRSQHIRCKSFIDAGSASEKASVQTEWDSFIEESYRMLLEYYELADTWTSYGGWNDDLSVIDSPNELSVAIIK